MRSTSRFTVPHCWSLTVIVSDQCCCSQDPIEFQSGNSAIMRSAGRERNHETMFLQHSSSLLELDHTRTPIASILHAAWILPCITNSMSCRPPRMPIISATHWLVRPRRRFMSCVIHHLLVLQLTMKSPSLCHQVVYIN